MTIRITDLQAEVLNPDRKVSDLLRLVWSVGRTRRDTRLCQWAWHELNGYPPGPIHPYRIVSSRLCAGTPLPPVPFNGNTMGMPVVCSTYVVTQPVGEMESFVHEPHLSVMFEEAHLDIARRLPLGRDIYGQVPRVFHLVHKPTISAIVDHVRTLIWMQAYAPNGDSRKPGMGFTADLNRARKN